MMSIVKPFQLRYDFKLYLEFKCEIEDAIRCFKLLYIVHYKLYIYKYIYDRNVKLCLFSTDCRFSGGVSECCGQRKSQRDSQITTDKEYHTGHRSRKEHFCFSKNSNKKTSPFNSLQESFNQRWETSLKGCLSLIYFDNKEKKHENRHGKEKHNVLFFSTQHGKFCFFKRQKYNSQCVFYFCKICIFYFFAAAMRFFVQVEMRTIYFVYFFICSLIFCC